MVDAMPTLHILHTNDLHNRLTPEQAHEIRRLKQRFAPAVLLVDAGDAVKAGNLGAQPREPILTCMAETGYDAMAMGNRESHPTQGALAKKLRDARVPVLAANLRAKQDRQPPKVVRAFFTRRVPVEAGEKCAVVLIGLAPQITAPDSWWARVTDYIFDDPLKTGPGLAKKLRPNADLLVVLSHIGYEKDVELCASPDIDLVIGGHSHRAVCPPEQHGHAYLASTAGHATHIGHLTVTVEPGKGITALSGELIPLSPPR
jgi:2',3'-cyclic-nucleotide 2'-phosphodiesterase (5'-nucleotidase family)